MIDDNLKKDYEDCRLYRNYKKQLNKGNDKIIDRQESSISCGICDKKEECNK